MKRIYKDDRKIVNDCSEQSFIKAIENSLASYPFFLSKWPGAVLKNEPELLWVATGIPIYFYNGVFRSQFTSQNANEKIEQIIEEFKKRKLSMVWQIGPSSKPSDLGNRLVSHGFEHDEDEPGMALDLLSMNDQFETPSDFVIKKVINDEMLKEFIRVWVFGAPDAIEMTEKIHLKLGYRDNQSATYYVGYLNHKPVASAMLYLAEGVAAIHNVVTLPEARNQGIGTAMTIFPLEEARNQGYRVAILTASDDGINIYRKIGFKEYCTISKYVLHI